MAIYYLKGKIEFFATIPGECKTQKEGQPQTFPNCYTLYIGAGGLKSGDEHWPGQDLPMSKRFFDGEFMGHVAGDELHLKFSGCFRIPTYDALANNVFKPAVKSKDGVHVNELNYHDGVNSWIFEIKSETISISSLATRKPVDTTFPLY